MSAARFYALVSSLIVCAAVGCRTAQHRGPAQDAPDVVHYSGDTPVWVFIPSSPWEATDRRGFPSQIALRSARDYTTNRIEVAVSGEVLSSRAVHLRSGSTVLQAVSCAGGFTEYALMKTIHVTGGQDSYSPYTCGGGSCPGSLQAGLVRH